MPVLTKDDKRGYDIYVKLHHVYIYDTVKPIFWNISLQKKEELDFLYYVSKPYY
jgi:hypothetical protein